MLHKSIFRTLSVLGLAAVVAPAWAQSLTVKEDFTQGTTTNTWLSFNGACLTAGTGTDQTHLPGCLKDYYYNSPQTSTGTVQTQFGGYKGYLGSTSGTGATQSVDPVGYGALRLTNGSALKSSQTIANGYHQSGAIFSNFNFPLDQGVQITFKTVTYGGDSQGNGGSGSVSANDGADGLTFFLLDDSIVSSSWDTPLDSGAFGGSLGYTCNNGANYDSTTRSDNSVRGYDGIIGAYMAVGVDEYGNFLNPSDNTATGPGLQASRIGLRGAGSVAWKGLLNLYPKAYGAATWTTDQQQNAVKYTCKSGYLEDYNGNYFTNPTVNANTSTSQSNGVAAPDYAMLKDATGAGAYKVLSLSSGKIAAEASLSNGNNVPIARSAATPIAYNVNITQDGKLSFSYSYNGGTWQPVVTAVPFTANNGALPANVRFGFAGSNGGASNIHEILCFAAQPSETSGSSGSINVYQNPTIRSNTQIFLANYFPSSWSGQLTAQTIGLNSTGTGIVANTTPNWDARCVLTGLDAATKKCDSTGATSATAEAWQAGSAVGSGRQLLTWDSVGKTGVPLEYPTSSSAAGSAITSAMVNTIDAGDSSQDGNRLNFLRGDRSNEINGSAKTNLYRTRLSVLGDIVDSSPTWVGPPQTYNNMDSWVDTLYGPGSGYATPITAPENSGQKYSAFQTLYTANTANKVTGRTNVVYVGGNDGFVHGFRAGTLDQFGNLVTTYNDGTELLGYMPGAVFNAIHSTANTELDYPNTQYSHAWYVDSTPGSGDLFYTSSSGANSGTGGTWHTWLVGGLGAGGAAIYALDITDPGTTFLESNASSLVIGEWTPSNITCVKTTPNPTTACGTYMGNTYGTPLIRRFHNGQWGVIFGNGYGSTSGTAGIFIMLVNPSTAAKTFYYLPTSSTATSNGIGPTTSADFDSDHITDYIYAGDLQGNIWRFDVTDPSPANWAVSKSSPLYKGSSAQPITAAVTVSTLKTINYNLLTGKVLDTKPQRVIINFGTGQQTAQTLTASAQYMTSTQTLYGVWDWDMGTTGTGCSGWNCLSAGQQGIGLTSGAPQPITQSNLVQQTFSASGTSGSISSPKPVCWPTATTNTGLNNPQNSASCSKTEVDYGWYMNLSTSTSNGTSVYEQVIFDPTVNADGVFIVNTYIPASNSPLNCTPGTFTGWTYALEPDSGAGAPTGGYFLNSSGAAVDGMQLNGVGTPSFISTGSQDNNTEFMLTQNGSGLATPTAVQRHSVVAGARLNWIQRR